MSNVSHLDRGLARLFPSRLVEARVAKRLNMSELARLIGVSPQVVSMYELGNRQPDGKILSRIAHELNQPIRYFTTERFDLGDINKPAFFRSFKSKTKKTNRMCEVWRMWLNEIVGYLEGYVDFPSVSIPHLGTDWTRKNYPNEYIEEIAELCRRIWGLGDGPIANLVTLIESNGFIVTRAEFGVDNVDAFSYWNKSRPVIFLGSDKGSCARSRFDAAHELGHIILHSSVTIEELENRKRLQAIEKEADRFAGAFLLPFRSFPEEVYSSRISHFIELKRRWNVSMAAMIYRCGDLGILSEEQVLNLRKQISARKMRKVEPFDLETPLEYPTMIRKSVDMIVNEWPLDSTKIVSDLTLSPRTIEELCGLTRGVISEVMAKPVSLELKRKARPGD